MRRKQFARSQAKPVSRVRVAVVSAVRLDRDATATALAAYPEFDIVAAVASTADLPTGASTAPQVVLVCAPPGAVARIAREVATVTPEARIVARVLSHDDEREVLASAEAGVMGFVAHDASIEDLIGVIRCAAHGELRYATPVAISVLREFIRLTESNPRSDDSSVLTRREREVVALLRTHSNKAIAQRLGIELATVKNHVHNVLAKLKLHRRTDAAAALQGKPPPPTTM